MSIFSNKKVVGILGSLIVIILLFIVVPLLSSMFESDIRQFVGIDTLVSKFVYVFVTALAIIIAPISTLPSYRSHHTFGAGLLQGYYLLWVGYLILR